MRQYNYLKTIISSLLICCFLSVNVNAQNLAINDDINSVSEDVPVLEPLEPIEEVEQDEKTGENPDPAESSPEEDNVADYSSTLFKYKKLESIKEKHKNFVARDYILGPNDVLNISVGGIPEFAQPGLRVNPEGKLNIMHLGLIDVAGLTLEELKALITKSYSEIILNPDVIINITQNRPFIVYITGAVLNPGSYELNTVPNTSPYFTKPEAFIERKTPLLSNVILAAGGLSYDADIEHIKIVNELDNSSHEVNLFSLLSDGKNTDDIFLMAGDKVIVPRLPSPAAIDIEKYKILVTSTLFQRTVPVRVIGYVNSPGLVNLNSAQSSNVNSAIAAAGGYLVNYGSYPKLVYVSRLDNNKQLITLKVNPLKDDMVLMPNDVVYVPEKTLPLVAKLFDYTIRLMNPFNVFSNTYNSWDAIDW